MRYYCDMPGLEANWVDVSNRWTRREVREMHEVDGEEFMSIWRSKVTACYLERPGQDPITDPADVTEDSIDDMDLRLLGFIGGVLTSATRDLRTLGNVSGRLSSDGNGQKMTVAQHQPPRS